MRRCILSMAVLLQVVLVPTLQAARMHHVHTGDMLELNAVALRSGVTASLTSAGEYDLWLQEVVYGISDEINFLLGVPLVSLGGIEDSTILGDIDFQVQARLAQWQADGATMFSTVWLLFGWRAGLGVESGEGKPNPETGLVQTYTPWATGRSSFWLGAGYSFPVSGIACHLNFTWRSETGKSGDPLEFVFRDDAIEIGGSVEYTFEITPDFAVRPFYEMEARLAWDETSPVPSRLENTIGFWMRIGQMFRVTGGLNLPVALESPRYLKQEYFFSVSAVFR